MLGRFFFCLLLLISPISVYCRPSYLYINLLPHRLGMFSVLSYVTGVLHSYENEGKYTGVTVNFEEIGLYYDPAYGPNWWEYYFEPIKHGNIQTKPKKFSLSEYKRYATFAEKDLHHRERQRLIKKYIKVKSPIQNKVDEYVLDNFTGSPVIGVHYRGTDKSIEAPRVSFDKVISCIQEYIEEKDLKDYKIFVATDELEFLTFMESSFPHAILVYSTQYSTDGSPLHENNPDKFLHGEEALIDCLLLARTDVLIRTSSNLSLWSTYFSPSLPVIELNKRYSQKK